MADLLRGFEHLAKPSTAYALDLIFPQEEENETFDELVIKSIVNNDVFGENEEKILPLLLAMVREWESKVNDYVSKHAEQFQQPDDRRLFQRKCFETFWKMVSHQVNFVNYFLPVLESDCEKH